MPTPWKTIRVFISSTFKDMQAERDHLVRFVFPKLREELLPHRIHLVDVDLRWGVTSDENALGVCRKVIDECHPRFMGILGGRYGWVPEGSDASITADEVHYGVLSRDAEKRGHAFFYFREEADSQAIPEADARAGGYREFAQPKEIQLHGEEKAEAMARDRAAKLAALKQAVIAAGLPVFPYRAEWNDRELRLTGLKDFGDRVFSDLLQSIRTDPEFAARFSEGATVAPDEFTEEAEQMEAFIEERTERFVIGSREPLMRDLLAFAATDPAVAGNIFVLTGYPGSGKSALLAQFVRSSAFRRFLAPPEGGTPNPPLIIPHFIGASTGSTDLRRTLRRLCHDLARAAGNTEPLPLDIKELIIHFQKLLTEAAGSRRVILVFDALDQFDATDGAHWLNWLPRELPPGVRLVASVIAPADGQPEHQTLAILRHRPGTRMEKLEPLTEADTLAVIEGSLRRYKKRLSPEQLAALLAKPAGRLPLYVLTALEELRTLGTYEEITERIRTLPGDARALFGWILTERLARDPGFRDREGRPCCAALVEKFAACLGVSRHGLSLAELTALLDPGDPLGNVAALLRLLRPYLMRRGELLDFYHGQFREAAGAAHLDTPEKQRAAHQTVATCLQAFADPHCDGQCRDATPHALNELPHHQTRAEAWPDLIATLENIFFLEAKVTHGMAFDLAEDFTAAVDVLPSEHAERQRLRLLEEALRRDIHFVARHAHDYPQALFQCLWNSAWWLDCPEAVKHYAATEGNRNNSREKLHLLLEKWRSQRETAKPSFCWIRSLRLPPMHLGTAQYLVLRGHTGGVASIAYSPNGQRIVSGVEDKTVRIWDGISGAQLAVIRGHDEPVSSVAYSPDGRWIVSGGYDRTVRVWDAVSGTQLAVLHGHEDWVSSVAYSPDGRRIISGGYDRTVRVWDAVSGTQLAVLHGHEDWVSKVAYSPDGMRIGSGSWDKSVRIWDAQLATETRVLRGHECPVSGVAFSPDGRRIVSASRREMCSFYVGRTIRQRKLQVITDADRDAVRVWDVETCAAHATLRRLDEQIFSVAHSPDGKRVIRASGSAILTWDAEGSVESAALCGHEQDVASAVYSPDGRWIVSGSYDRTVRVWASDNNCQITPLRGHVPGKFKTGFKVDFSPDGSRILTWAGDGSIRLWNAHDATELAVLIHERSDDWAFSPDGTTIVVWDYERLHICNATNGTELQVRSKDENIQFPLLFSPDGSRNASIWRDGTIRVVDANNGAELAVLHGHHVRVTGIAFSKDSSRIVSWAEDEICVWDTDTGTQLALLRGHEGRVIATAFSPDGRRIVSGAADKTARVWDVASRTQLAVLRGHQDMVHRVAFSPDGTRVVTGAHDRMVRVWDTASGECLELIDGGGDVPAIAAEFSQFPWRALARQVETVIQDSATGQPVAWFGDEIGQIRTHPAGRKWGGAVVHHLYVVQLEGGETESDQVRGGSGSTPET